jgi:aminopeptidase N
MNPFYPAARGGVKFLDTLEGMRRISLTLFVPHPPGRPTRLGTAATDGCRAVPLRLAFVVDLAHERFDGTETIRVQVAEPTSRVVLNAVEIQFREVTIGTGAAAQTATVALDEAAQTATLTVPKPLAKGPTEIHVRFSGVLNTQLRGFYISKTKLRKYAVTQFESTDARRAFPCFDEPAFKATFGVTLTIDRGDTAISNGRVLSDVPGPAVTQHTMKFSTPRRCRPIWWR